MWSVFFVFLSYLDRNFATGEPFSFYLDAEKEDKVLFYMLDYTLCGKISTAGENSFYEVSDGVEKVRSVHNSAGNLVDCSVTTNDIHVKSFMHICRLGLREQKRDPTGPELKLANVTEAKANCNKLKSKNTKKSVTAQAQNPIDVQASADTAKHTQTLRRSKRGFTYPGTLWCGAGNIADNYDQLGEFAETDECCRTHDHCPNVIHAFSSKYGYTNFKWHSISHCDCDNALKQCLRDANDTSSRVVGQAFFNVIEAPCFEFSFEEQCVERYWYGVCKRYGKVPVAVLKESIPYDFGGIEVIDVLTISPPKKNLAEVETAQGSESTTQSSFSGSKKSSTQEEPSLTNVVTAAEDFIKVLATVSTSQSSSADSGREDAQTADRKRKKNAGKKRKDSKKTRGKGKKRKQSEDVVPTAEERVVRPAPAQLAEVVISKNSLVEDPGNFEQVSDNFMNGSFSQAGDQEHYDTMMRDEYQRQASTTATPQANPNTETLELPKQIKETEPAWLSPAIHSTAASKRRRTGVRQRKRKGHLTPLPAEVTVHNRLGAATPVSATESTALAGLTTCSSISPAAEEAPRSSERQHEKGSAFTATAQNRPIVGAKRPRSRKRGGRKRSRKLCTSASPTNGEAPPPLTADEPVVLTSSPAQELRVSPSGPPQSSAEPTQSSTEGGQPDRLEGTAERPVSSMVDAAGTLQLTQRLHRLKGAGGRRCAFRPSAGKDVSKKRRKATVITVSRTKTNPNQPGVDTWRSSQTEPPEASTGNLFPPSQTSTSSASPLSVETSVSPP